MSEEVQKQPEPANHAEEKTRLELDKLRAEIKAIGKPLFKTPGFYSAFAPVALAILGLIFTWSTGWFDVQRTRVSNEKTLLEAQTERLKTERTTLEGQAKEQQARFEHAEDEIGKLRQRESSLTNLIVRLEREREELGSAKALLESETKRLAGSDAKATEFLNQLKSLQATREKQTALIRWANEVLSEGWGIALKDKSTWTKFRDFGDKVLDVHLASTPYLPEWQVEPDPVPLPNQMSGRTYDDDVRKEMLRSVRQMSGKTAEDILNEVIERKIRNGEISESEANDLRKRLVPLVHTERISQDASASNSIQTNR